MANILCKTRGGSSPQGKPRVYFTCHPVDFEKYFEKICQDIFATHDCAIYYTEDMTAPIPEADWETDLGSNNLFVVPVTLKLLTQPNRAMDQDIPYALQKHLPVLPIMMEPGLDAIYARPDKFGELQYLNPQSADLTEVSYEEKLKKYLESVLISEEMAKRVRDAFDAYIFLSYRKKDRRYANELMRLIHKNPEYRDIAIWYDEFLTPGESFRDNIEKALEKSQLFTLLVTPNLLEEPNGKPNFVMGQEYPAARNSGIDILPAEMEETNKDLLQKSYPGIPGCVNARNDAALRERLLSAIDKMAVPGNNNDPEHMFLIGLAYLEGIDVEMDRQRGLEMITSAAEAGFPKAMQKLFDIYRNGIGVPVDYKKAAKWAQGLAGYCETKYGDASENTLTALENVAVSYAHAGDPKKALELGLQVYKMKCEALGETHHETLTSLGNLAVTYGKLGDHRRELELDEKVYTHRCEILGNAHKSTLHSLNNLAEAHVALGDYQKALELHRRAYELRCVSLGEEHPDTVMSLGNLGTVYGLLGDHAKALQLKEKAYTLRCRLLGETHPDTLTALNNLAATYGDMGDHRKALELFKKVYTLQCEILGEDHFDIISTLMNLALGYRTLGDYINEVKMLERLYSLQCRFFGEDHPEAQNTLQRFSIAQQKRSALRREYRRNDLCQYCGGKFKGLFKRVCSQCGKPKNY